MVARLPKVRGVRLLLRGARRRGRGSVITYKDCPECGANKIRESVSLCDAMEGAEA